MSVPIRELTRNWSAERLALVEARAKELIGEEFTMRDLRKARALTQSKVARKLGIGQDQVSRLEQQSDMLLSTLANYVRAMGGELALVARFPDRPPLKLTNLADVFDAPAPKSRSAKKQPRVKRKIAA